MMSLIADETYSAGAFPAAQFCADLSIGGFTDWYLPSRLEFDIAYFNLKPSTQVNNTSWGANIYSVPRRPSNNSRNFPIQTTLTDFTTTTEAFVADNHWSSTEALASNAWFLGLNNGIQNSFSVSGSKTNDFRVRAFRKLAL